MYTKKTIVIAAGGTGGHIFPGLAIAEELINKGYKVIWIGTKLGLEVNLIPRHGIDIFYIKVSGVRGKNCFAKILSPFKILYAICQSLLLLFKINPYIVLGMGGFVTGPVGVAAWLLKKKLLIHEQNAIAGTTNKILLYFADHVFESFPGSFAYSSLNKGQIKKIILTGNPIRKSLLTIRSKNIKLKANSNSKNNKIFNILVLGGSRGAQFLNQIIPNALGELSNVKILHQTGSEGFPFAYNIYINKNIKDRHEIKPFIDNMLVAYSQADLVICRAGASTVFEIMALGLASILIPLPWSIDDHQNKNAIYLSSNNAAIVFNQSELTEEKLRRVIIELIADPDKLRSIKIAARSLYDQHQYIKAVDQILNYC